MGGNGEANDEVLPECLDAAEIQALVDGRLSGHALARAEHHLHRCSMCAGIVADAAHGADSRERPTREPEGAAVAHRSDAVPGSDLARGDQIDGKYEIERLLKQGGMGAVFSARHLALGHRVAIKVLRAQGGGAAARFVREAKTCASFVGDHIVRVSDFGRLPDGAPYLIMEHLSGRDLAQVIAEGPVPPAEAVRYVREACAGLREAHAAGVIHRDLKPSNLFLVERPLHRPTIKVLDFGISKIVRPESRETTLTSTGVVIGSPLYMSPEQVRSVDEIDVRTDVWALGVILYELLTGRPPFRAPTLSALAIVIVTHPCPRPSAVNPALDAALDAIVLRCLEKDPAQRFESVDALADALAHLGDQRGDRSAPRTTRPVAMVAARPLDTAEASSAGRVSPRSRMLQRLALATMLVGLCALLPVTWLRQQSMEPSDSLPQTSAERSVSSPPVTSPAAITPTKSPETEPLASSPSTAMAADAARSAQAASPDASTPVRPFATPHRRRAPSVRPAMPSLPKQVGPLDTPD